MTSHLPLLICVVGPTAIGKTSLAIALAEAFETEIISADSRQFYKEMTIGTAVPSSEELAVAKHHFIQNKSIFDAFNVGDFEKEALQCLAAIFQKNQVAILVGGSGLYVDSVVRGLDIFPDVAPDIRTALNIALVENGIESLQKELKSIDPTYYDKADIQNPHRVIRALEIYRASGQPFSSFLNQGAAKRNFKTIYIGLDADRETIYDRINQRVDQMFSEGLLAEAKLLYPHKELNALQTVGYRELFAHFDGTLSLNEAVSEIKKNTRRFAKRQGTWFRKNEQIEWFNFETDPAEIVSHIKTKNAL